MKNNKILKAILIASLIPTTIISLKKVDSFSVCAATAVTSSTVTLANYEVGEDPCGLKVSYYSDVYSRGFSWQTSSTAATQNVWLLKSSLGEQAFSGDINGLSYLSTTTCTEVTANSKTYKCYKSYDENLDPSTTYSYRVGSEGHYKYGTFKTADLEGEKISVLFLTDAQTKQSSLLYKWENTVKQAFDTVPNCDFVLYGGDQYDDNADGNASKVNRYSGAIDTISNIIGSTPYMATQGNHEYCVKGLYNKVNSVAFAQGNTSSTAEHGYYSFDYYFAHFIVLDSNGDFANQKTWLISDLQTSNANQNIKWNIVMIHNGPHCTGDHSNDSKSQNIVTTFTPVFSQYHVDLVIQGHDHVYNKSLPYKWDSTGYTETYSNSNAVNFETDSITIDEETYDVNPNGTYYVTAGAAGHRAGISAGETDGNWAELVEDDEGRYEPLNSDKTFITNKYKVEVSTIKYGGTIGQTTYKAGAPATGNVDGQMFGALSITEDKLSYDFYTVDGDKVNLFDSLNVAKMSEEEQILAADGGENNEEEVKDLLSKIWDAISGFASNVIEALRSLVSSIVSALERDRETTIDSATKYDGKLVTLQSIQTSEAKNNLFNIRFIGGVYNINNTVTRVGFNIKQCTGNDSFGDVNNFEGKTVYSTEVSADSSSGFVNAKTVTEMNGGKLFALTINNVPATGTVKFYVQPYAKTDSETTNGTAFVIEMQEGIVKSLVVSND